MHLSDFISPDSVLPSLRVKSKKQLLQELSSRAARRTGLPERVIFDVLLQRERLGSTGLGQGIAIPHAKTDQAAQVVAAFGLSRRGVQFDALDGDPVHIVFLLVAPPDAAALHLKALARISRLLKDKFFRQSLRETKTAAEILKLIKEEDQF